MLAALALLASSFVPTALATISIGTPSSSVYWVANISKPIQWSFSQGDPSPVTIVISNPDNSTLNGNFSVAENVNAADMQFVLTNVTLKNGTGYVVSFVNGSNPTQIFASSGSFDVKPAGTPVAAGTPSSSGNGTASGSASGSGSPSVTASGSASGSGAPSPSGSAGAQSGGAIQLNRNLFLTGVAGMVALASLVIV